MWKRGDYTISTDTERLDFKVVHGFLETSYWAKGIPARVVRRSIKHSRCFGLYKGATQVGFARVVTDRATFAYRDDVFVVAAHRGRGLSKWLIEVVLAHPDLQGLRRWMLATADAHGLYRKFGFKELKSPAHFMERHEPNVYAARESE